MSAEVFNYVKNADETPDYTGAKADYYLQKYVDRPEDAGNLKDFQKSLSDMGILVPPADVLNAALYAVQGEWGMAGLSAAAVIPLLGDINKVKKFGEKTVKIYRGYEKWYPGKMVENGHFVSSGELSTRMVKGGTKKVLYTTTDKSVAKGFAKGGVVLEFEVPESYLKKNASNAWGKKVLKSIDDLEDPAGTYLGMPIFEKGLPKEFLKRVVNLPLNRGY